MASPSPPSPPPALVQYLKIFIAYLQVLGSFVAFQVTWPGLVGDTLLLLNTFGDLIKIDLLEFPGVACLWVSYSYEFRFHVKMIIPIAISVLLAFPIPVAWYLASRGKNQRQVSQPAGSEVVESDQTSAVSRSRTKSTRKHFIRCVFEPQSSSELQFLMHFCAMM